MIADPQFALFLPYNTAQGGEDFFITHSNREAASWVNRWPDWPHHAAIFVGEAGAGKSHLAAVWRAKTQARALTVQEITSDSVIHGIGRSAVLVEDVDRMIAIAGDNSLETGLFHVFNWVREQGGTLLLTARVPVSGWGLRLADLRSRLAATPTIALGTPDEQLLEAVMVKLFADRQTVVSPDVVRFALPRIERSFAAVHDFVDALDRASLAAKRPVTVPLARSVLGTGNVLKTD